MGNLRDKYTNEEWSEMEAKIENDRNNGKPVEIFFTSINLEARC